MIPTPNQHLKLKFNHKMNRKILKVHTMILLRQDNLNELLYYVKKLHLQNFINKQILIK
jgi:hypothetical protein